MTSLNFVVPVAADTDRVHITLTEASTEPGRFVELFTTSTDVTADVRAGSGNMWHIQVEGPQFRSSGTATVSALAFDGSQIEIRVELRGKGLMGFASPLLSLASGRIEGEATEALQKEFGVPTEPRSGPR